MGLGDVIWIFTVRGPVAVKGRIGSEAAYKEPLALDQILSHPTTLWAVTGVPSANFTRGRNVNSNSRF